MKTLQCVTLFSFMLISIAGNSQDNSDKIPKDHFKLIQDFFDTYNKNDKNSITSFAQKSFNETFLGYGLEGHTGWFLGKFYETGPLHYHSLFDMKPDNNEYRVYAKDENELFWYRVTLIIDKNENKIAGLDMNPALAPLETLEHSITENELVETTKKYFDYLGKKDLISGTILLAKGDRILYLDSCGEASKRFHVPNNTNTKFNLGSINKMFTGIAIVKLAQEGKLSFNEKLDKYVDESWLSKETASKVSIHQLLTHSSGLGDYFSDTYWNSSRELYRNLNDFKPLVEDTLYFEPGSSFQYSNTGMLLLGVVIEKVTGQSYFDYIKEKIYIPCGMINTDSYEMDVPVENLAIGYMRAGNEYGWKNNIFTHVLKGGPAGGGFSTVHDLHKFGVSLLKGEILEQKNLDILFDFHQELPKSMTKGYRYSHYGYGFMMGKKDDQLNIGHLGGFPGISSGLNIETNSGYMIVTLSNYDLWGAFLNLVIRDQIMRVKK